jgi:hypothetical protein
LVVCWWDYLELEKKANTDETGLYSPFFFIRWPADGKRASGSEWSSAVRRGVAAGRGAAGGRAGELD